MDCEVVRRGQVRRGKNSAKMCKPIYVLCAYIGQMMLYNIIIIRHKSENLLTQKPMPHTPPCLVLLYTSCSGRRGLLCNKDHS